MVSTPVLDPSPCVQLQPLGHPGVWTAVAFRNICLEASHLVLVVLHKVKFLHILRVKISCLMSVMILHESSNCTTKKTSKETSKSNSYPATPFTSQFVEAFRGSCSKLSTRSKLDPSSQLSRNSGGSVRSIFLSKCLRGTCVSLFLFFFEYFRMI